MRNGIDENNLICIVCGDVLQYGNWDFYICVRPSCKTINNKHYPSIYGAYFDDNDNNLVVWFNVDNLIITVDSANKLFHVCAYDDEGLDVDYYNDNKLIHPIDNFEDAAKVLKYFNF
jgi:hypothetical protein